MSNAKFVVTITKVETVEEPTQVWQRMTDVEVKPVSSWGEDDQPKQYAYVTELKRKEKTTEVLKVTLDSVDVAAITLAAMGIKV